MTIYLPDGETNEKDRLLACLMDWTSTPTIIQAMREAGRADYVGLSKLAAMVKATVDRPVIETADNTPGGTPTLGERQLVCAILAFLDEDSTILAISRHVATAYRDQLVRKGERLNVLSKARSEVLDLKAHLVRTHGIEKHEIPRFLANPQEQEMLAVARTAALFSNPALAYDPANPPEWIERYRQSAAEFDSDTIEWLRSLPADLQELARRFPPLSLVRSPEARFCPAPGQLAFVVDYAVDDGVACVVVCPDLRKEARTTGCRPEWLECVACRGYMDWAAVDAALGKVATA